MGKPVGVIFAFVGAALAVAVVGQAIQVRGLKREVEMVRESFGRLETRQKEAPTKADVAEVQGQIARVEKKADARPPAPPPARIEAPPPTVTEEDIQKIVDERLDTKLAARDEKKKEEQGDRKVPLHDLAKELALDAATQAKVAEVANVTKKQILDLLKTPRPGAKSLADELVEAFTSGDTQRVQQTFLKAFSEKIPGSDVTYITGVGRIQEVAHQNLQRLMGPETYQRFSHMNLKPENIETGFDPWSEFVQERQ